MRFGIDLAGIVHETFAPDGDPMTLVKVSTGELKDGGISGRETSTTEYPCAGYRVEYDSSRIDDEMILKNDCELRIYPRTLPDGVRPSGRDTIVHDGTTFSVVMCKWDQAKSMHVVQARGPAVP